MEATVAAPFPEIVNKDPIQGSKYDFERDLIGYGEQSFNPEWPEKKKIAVSFVLNYEEGGERSFLNGDEITEYTLTTPSKGVSIPFRAFDLESEYNYGSRVGVWRILKLFKKYSYPITAYAVGRAFEQNKPVVEAFLRDGHEIASHAYRWIPYAEMTPELEKAYIKKQLETIKELTGEYPQGWYYGRLSTHSLGLVVETYKEMGIPLAYISDNYSDDVPFWAEVPAEKDLPKEEKKGLLYVPYSYDNNDYRFLNANGFRSAEAFYQHMKNSFDVLYEEGGKMMTVGLHCRIIGKPGYFPALQRFVEYVSTKEDVWVTTRKDIASHFRGKFPYEPKN